MEKTIHSFKKSLTIGAGKWEEAYQVKYLEMKGFRIGFFSATQADFAALKDKWTDRGITGCPWINHYEVNQIIARESKNCDFLFVIPHAGVEYMDIPLPEWRDRYKELIDYGADAVIAAHPHVPQGWETYKSKPIFYSLGNFFFDLHKSESDKPKLWDNGLIVTIENIDENFKIKVIPTIKEKNYIRIDYTALTHIDEITNVLRHEKHYMSEVNNYVLKFYKQRKVLLLRGFNAEIIRWHWKSIGRILYSLLFQKQKLSLALAHLRSESSRFIFNRALKIITKTKL